jgi:hypothetical protein
MGVWRKKKHGDGGSFFIYLFISSWVCIWIKLDFVVRQIVGKVIKNH